MSTSFFSQLWYRVATLKPALKPNLEIALHSYRGAPWYVIRDPMTGKVHRFTAASYALIGAMTGSATLQDIWQASVTRLGAAAPSQDDVVQLLMQLNQSDLLLVDSVPIADELIERMERQRGQKRAKFWKNPMAVPLPLFDPDRLLEALSPLVRGPMGWVWAALWFALIGTVLAVLPSQWAALTATGIREVLALQNLVILACVYPVVKLLHELAHGLVAKRYGAEVHEVGVMFLVFFPVPYVDASASAAFPEKGQRALVGAAGILAELAMAALALFVWVAAEPGLVRDVAFNVMLISGFSTLIVNGNPLLKFDGYYVFSDVIEVPNLAPRSNAWWGHLVRRRILDAPAPELRPVSRFEAVTFALYAPAAFVYRLVVMLGIALFVAGSYFVVGVVLACWSIFQGFVLPAGKAISHLFRDPKLAEKQGRAALAGTLAVAAVAALLFVVPLPLVATAEGVVWVPDDSHVRAQTAGRVASIEAIPGTHVEAGAKILRLQAIALTAERRAQAARVEEARVIASAERVNNPAAYRIAAERLRQAEAELAVLDTRFADLDVRAPRAGRLVIENAGDLIGRHLAAGTIVGQVLPPASDRIRAALPQSLAEFLPGDRAAGASHRMAGVHVRLSDRPGHQIVAAMDRTVPTATTALPSPALASSGGGRFDLDPRDPDAMTTVDRFIQVDFTMAPQPEGARFGSRAFVKLDFGWEPVGHRLIRVTRRTFLRYFGGNPDGA